MVAGTSTTILLTNGSRNGGFISNVSGQETVFISFDGGGTVGSAGGSAQANYGIVLNPGDPPLDLGSYKGAVSGTCSANVNGVATVGVTEF